MMSKPACNRLVDDFVTVNEPGQSVVPVLLRLFIGEDLSETFTHKQRLRRGMKLVAAEVKISVRMFLVKIDGQGKGRGPRR